MCWTSRRAHGLAQFCFVNDLVRSPVRKVVRGANVRQDAVVVACYDDNGGGGGSYMKKMSRTRRRILHVQIGDGVPGQGRRSEHTAAP